ncbi:MAG: Txe/YoeB family addiction module toxin [Cyclonatronaceae bacterium]
MTGTGTPEALKHQLTGMWSRRINHEHQLVYEVEDNIVFIISAKGHYK